MDSMDARGTVGRIYKEDHYTLLHTKYERYESSGPCGFGDFFYVLCKLSIAMETTMLIQSAPKPNKINPNGSHQI